MKRGEIWWVNFDPSVGGEINKIRPAIIISVYVIVNGKQSKAMTDQIMTASKLTAKALLRGSVSRYCERLQGAWQSRKNNKNAMHFTRLLRQNL